MNNRELQIVHAASKHGDREGLPTSAWLLGRTVVGLTTSPYKPLPGCFCINNCIISFFSNRFFSACPKFILEDATIEAESRPVTFEPDWGWAIKIFVLHLLIICVCEYNFFATPDDWGSLMGMTVGFLGLFFLIYMGGSQFREAVFGDPNSAPCVSVKTDPEAYQMPASATEKTPLLEVAA